MKDLSALSNQELQEFFNSFDYFLSDVDGVLWNLLETVPGTQEAIHSLKKIGKKVIFVSNNTAKSINAYHKQLTNAGFDIDIDDIVTPSLATISYLKKQDLQNKEIFVVGMTPLKKALERAGFKIAQNGPDRISEAVGSFTANTIVDDGSVGAVIVDVDINLNYVNLQKVATFLERPEVVFLKGASDRHLAIGMNRVLIGPGYFIEIVEDITGRKGLPMAKPSPYLRQYITEKFKIDDASRVLFVGDSIPSDMGFAAQSKWRKLLVLSGLTKKEELRNWTFPDEYKPDFYADSLKNVHEAILRVCASKL